MKKLLRKRKYLETILSSHISPKNGQHLSQETFGEVNSNIHILRLRSTNSKANNQDPCKVEIRTPSKRYHKIY